VNLGVRQTVKQDSPYRCRIGDLSPGGNAGSYLPWLALSYSVVVLLSVELMCASGGGQVSRNMVRRRLDQERPVLAVADRFRCGEDDAEDIDRYAGYQRVQRLHS
jgi:hypothetical protein